MRVKHLEINETPRNRKEYVRIYHREYQKLFREEISRYNRVWMSNHRNKIKSRKNKPKLYKDYLKEWNTKK